MPQQLINIGPANGGQGDTPFTYCAKINANFTEVYALAVAATTAASNSQPLNANLTALSQGTITGVGTTAGTLAAGNDTRIVNALQTSTLSAALDTAFSSARGSILYRGSTGWVALAPGTSGYVLATGGAGADPAWTAQASGGSGVSSSALDSSFGNAQGSILYRNATAWVTLLPGTAGYVLQTGGAGANPSWAAPSASAGSNPAKDAQLNYTSPTALTLSGVDGAQLYIAGANRTVGTVTIPNGGAAPSTAYYIYASWSGSAVTGVFSTTAPVVDATTGLKFMTGDATKTLVGAAPTNASGQWQPKPVTSSYFNRRDQSANSGQQTASTSAGTSSELSTAYRVAAWVWGDEALDVEVTGYGSQNTGIASHYGLMQAATDQGVLGQVAIGGGIGSTSLNTPFASRIVTKPGSDGLRYGTAYGYIDAAGGFNASFTLTTIVKTRG